jgi:hypothetical protein
MQGVEAFQPFLQVGVELRGIDLHTPSLRNPEGFEMDAGFGVADALAQADARTVILNE